MITTLLTLQASMETFAIIAIAAVPTLLGAFLTWWVVSSLLDAFKWFARRR